MPSDTEPPNLVQVESICHYAALTSLADLLAEARYFHL